MDVVVQELEYQGERGGDGGSNGVNQMDTLGFSAE